MISEKINLFNAYQYKCSAVTQGVTHSIEKRKMTKLMVKCTQIMHVD